MNINVILEFDQQVNSWAAFCPQLPGCTSAGDTESEALSGIKEAIQLWFEPIMIPVTPSQKLVEVGVAV